MCERGGYSLKGVDTRRCPKDMGPKGGGFGGIPYRLEKGASANEDAGP